VENPDATLLLCVRQNDDDDKTTTTRTILLLHDRPYDTPRDTEKINRGSCMGGEERKIRSPERRLFTTKNDAFSLGQTHPPFRKRPSVFFF